MEVDTFHTIVLTCTAKKMQSSLGHEATDNNQMTPKRLSHLVIGHYEKLLPLDEFRLSPSYRWPWSSSAHVEYRLFSGPLHIIYYCQIFGRMLSGLISMKVINPPLSPVKIEQHFFLRGWQITEVKKGAVL